MQIYNSSMNKLYICLGVKVHILKIKPTCIYILSLICFARIDFSEQYHIEGKACDVRWHEKSVSSKAKKWLY
jgi:hypothetical protein